MHKPVTFISRLSFCLGTAKFLENEQIHIGGFEQETAIASLSFVKLSPTLLKMRQVCVLNEYQGKNIGKELINFSEKWGKDNGFSSIECNARESAIPFYKSNGYNKIGEQFFFCFFFRKK